jgi:hypothetical protein
MADQAVELTLALGVIGLLAIAMVVDESAAYIAAALFGLLALMVQHVFGKLSGRKE